MRCQRMVRKTSEKIPRAVGRRRWGPLLSQSRFATEPTNTQHPPKPLLVQPTDQSGLVVQAVMGGYRWRRLIWELSEATPAVITFFPFFLGAMRWYNKPASRPTSYGE